MVSDDDADEDADQQPGDDQVGERAADQPVDFVQPVLQDADADTDRQRRDRESSRVTDSGAALRNTDDESDDADRAAAEEPFQLLALLACRPAIAHDLADHPGEEEADIDRKKARSAIFIEWFGEFPESQARRSRRSGCGARALP